MDMKKIQNMKNCRIQGIQGNKGQTMTMSSTGFSLPESACEGIQKDDQWSDKSTSGRTWRKADSGEELIPMEWRAVIEIEQMRGFRPLSWLFGGTRLPYRVRAIVDSNAYALVIAREVSLDALLRCVRSRICPALNSLWSQGIPPVPFTSDDARRLREHCLRVDLNDSDSDSDHLNDNYRIHIPDHSSSSLNELLSHKAAIHACISFISECRDSALLVSVRDKLHRNQLPCSLSDTVVISVPTIVPVVKALVSERIVQLTQASLRFEDESLPALYGRLLALVVPAAAADDDAFVSERILESLLHAAVARAERVRFGAADVLQLLAWRHELHRLVVSEPRIAEFRTETVLPLLDKQLFVKFVTQVEQETRSAALRSLARELAALADTETELVPRYDRVLPHMQRVIEARLTQLEEQDDAAADDAAAAAAAPSAFDLPLLPVPLELVPLLRGDAIVERLRAATASIEGWQSLLLPASGGDAALQSLPAVAMKSCDQLQPIAAAILAGGGVSAPDNEGVVRAQWCICALPVVERSWIVSALAATCEAAYLITQIHARKAHGSGAVTAVGGALVTTFAAADTPVDLTTALVMQGFSVVDGKWQKELEARELVSMSLNWTLTYGF